MKFSVYRAPKTAQTATKNIKNSAERAAEDAEEEAKPVLPATGFVFVLVLLCYI
jgi:hypothetical protein